MAKQSVQEGDIVAPRHDPSPLEPYAKSKALELAGQSPDFEHHWFRRDELAEKLRPHEIGDKHVGFLMVDAWEVVDNTKGVTQGRSRDDAGKPVDTVMTNGELILCRTRKENHAKYAVIEKLRDNMIDKRLSGGEGHKFTEGTAGATFKTRTAGGRDSLDASATDIIAGVQ